MSTIPLAQAAWYTWASHPWLNTEWSYHRMIYEDRTSLHSPNSFQKLVCALLEQFESLDRSRLVVRILLQADSSELWTIEEFVSSLGGTLGYYPDQTADNPQPFWYITFSVNRGDRNPDIRTAQMLREVNRRYIAKVLNTMWDFGTHAIQKLGDLEQKWFRLTRNIQAHELSELWTPFGWSDEACKSVLADRNSGNFVLWVREENRRLVAVILYSHQPHVVDGGVTIQHGELTEATTAPSHRWYGIMGVLATALHVEALHSGGQNIYGEYRALWSDTQRPIQSLRFALESGVNFQTQALMINHVDIDDERDPHNQARTIPWYGWGEQQLKSFLLGALDNEKITPELAQTYLHSLS